MPIGATIGAAVVGAGASVYASSKSSKAQTQAAQNASNTELQVAQQNNAFAQSMYDQNAARLDPYAQFGLPAGNQIDEMLLGPAPNGGTYAHPAAAPGSTTGTTPAPAPSGYTGPSFNSILALKGNGITGDMGSAVNQWISYYQAHPSENPGITPAQIAALKGDNVTGDQQAVQAIYNAFQARPPVTPAPPATAPPAANNAIAGAVPAADRGPRPVASDYRGDPQQFRAALDAWRSTPAGTPAAGTPATGSATPPAGTPNSALSAWDKFRNSTDYQFQLDQGLKGVNTKYAALGAIESGAAMKAIDQYSQDYAKGALANYMDQLYRQEALGASAASSLAGVGTNLVSQVSANNSAAGSAAANAQLVAGQAQANQWGTIGSAIGSAAGTIGGALSSSYHPAPASQGPITVWNTGVY